MELPELDTLVRLVLIALIIMVALVLRRKASFLARGIVQLLWRLMKRDRSDEAPLDEQIAEAHLDEQIAVAITPPLRFVILVIALIPIFLLLQLPVSLEVIRAQFISALVGITIFWTLYRMVDIVAHAVEVSHRYAALDATVITFISQLAKVLIAVVMFVIIMGMFGVDLGAVLAALGIGGLAVALASQDAIANFIGYFFIVSDAPFRVGDYINVDTVEGNVEEITFRSTRLRKPDRAQIVIPNQTIVNAMIINWSRVDRRQIKTILGVNYDTSEAEMRALIAELRAMLKAHERVVHREPCLIEFDDYGASSLNLYISFYINTTDGDEMRKIKSDIYFRIMGILQKLGIGLAFPTTTINFDGTAREIFKPSEDIPEAQEGV